jgi:autotransporter-associated beta strand protein
LNFADATTAVFFGTTAATGFSIISPNEIMALSPAGAGTVDVTVVNAGGTSAALPAVQFTYLAAATLTWNGTASGNWTDPQWTGGGASYPNFADNAVIASACVVHVASNQAANGLEISNGGQVAVAASAILSVTTDTSVTGGSTLSVDPRGGFSTGGTLTLASGGILSGGPIAAAAYLLDDGEASANLSGPGGLTKDSSGRVVLSGANSYSGDTVVNQGTLIINSLNALPGGTNLTIGAGGTLAFDSSQATPSLSAAVSSPSAVAASASETATPSDERSALTNVPGTASAMSSAPLLVERRVKNLSYVPVNASGVSPASGRTSATPATMSSAAVDAVFKSDRSAFEQGSLSDDVPPDARPRASLPALEGSWSSWEQNQKNGASVETLDKVLARFGL